jgi:hypothetical protein
MATDGAGVRRAAHGDVASSRYVQGAACFALRQIRATANKCVASYALRFARPSLIAAQLAFLLRTFM